MSLITITQNFACGGLEVAEQVAKRLEWQLLDERKLRELMQTRGLSSEEYEKVDERVPGFWDIYFSNKPRMIQEVLESIIYSTASKADAVIVGHGSQILLRNFDCAFHVRLFASESLRADRLASGQGLSQENALALVHKRDKEQSGFFKFAFHKELDDFSLYDLVINTQKLDCESTASIIIRVAQSEALTACNSSALDWMDRLALERQIKAALISSGLVQPNISIEATGNREVQVSGVFPTDEYKRRVEAVIRSLPGVSTLVLSAGVIQGSSGE